MSAMAINEPTLGHASDADTALGRFMLRQPSINS